MRKLPPLGALRAFEAAARRASFKHAADELHVTPTAISHQIRALEDSLGVKLFERQTRKVRLTAAGHQLFPAVRDGLDGMERAVQAVQRSGRPHVATLTSTVAFMARRLAPLAGQFRAAHPDWTLRLDASDQIVDLDHDADAAIRYGSGSYPGLVTEPLFRDRFAPVCSPALKLASMQDLKQATLIHFEWGAAARAGLAPLAGAGRRRGHRSAGWPALYRRDPRGAGHHRRAGRGSAQPDAGGGRTRVWGAGAAF